MKESVYKTYEELPLFLNAEVVAKVLGIAPSSTYELMHEADFPVLKVGSRMVVPKEKFIQWVEDHTQGGTQWVRRAKTISPPPTKFFLWDYPPVSLRCTPTCSAVQIGAPVSAGPATKPLVQQLS